MKIVCGSSELLQNVAVLSLTSRLDCLARFGCGIFDIWI